MNKIAIISTQAFSLINFRGELIKELVSSGTQVYTIAPDYTNEIKQQIRLLGAEPIEYNFSRNNINPIQDSVCMLQLIALLKRLSPDVVLSYFIKPAIYGTLAAWLARIPNRVALITGLGYVFIQNGSKMPLKKKMLNIAVSLLYKIALSKATRVIFQNSNDRTEFINRNFVKKEKAIIIGGTGVNLNYWQYIPPIIKPITFILVARLLREKGIIQYAEAAKLVKSKYPNVRFLLLGDVDSNPGSLQKNEVQAWVNEGILEWPGHVQVMPWLIQSSVFVLPSFREGVPRSTQEAMAIGRAVITTDAPGCRETVVDGVNGFLVPVGDIISLYNAMLKFIDNPTLIIHMGKESRRLAEERFDVRLINKEFLNILRAG